MRRLLLQLFCVLLFTPFVVRSDPAAGSVPPPAVGVSLKHIGPGGGGAMFGVDFCPANPDIIVFGGDMGALYRTEDGGEHWAIIGGPSGDQPGTGGVWQVKFDHSHPNVVWAVGDGAYRSSDTGRTWRLMTTARATCGAVGIDPDNSGVVYVAEGNVPRQVIGWVRGRVWKTTDGGQSWTELPRPGGPVDQDPLRWRNYSNVIIDPNSDVIPGQGHARVYLVGRSGLFRSNDAGRTWIDLSTSFGPGQISDMCLVPTDNGSILLLSVIPADGFEAGGVYRSADDGNSWQPVNKGFEDIISRLRGLNGNLQGNRDAPLFSIMLAHSPPSNHSPSTFHRLYAGSYQGIARSDDLGESWTQVTPAEGTYAKDLQGHYVAVLTNTDHFKKSLWGGIDHFQRIAACVGDPDLVLFTDNEDIYASRDGGTTWTGLSFDYVKPFARDRFPGLPPNRYTHTVRSRGVQNIVSDQLVVDPFDPNTYYAAYMDLGLEISRDGGETWEHPTRGLPSRGHAWAVAVDPQNEGHVFVSIGQSHGRSGGIYRSEDKGNTWRRVGLDDDAMGVIRCICVDLNSPVENRTMWLGTDKKGLYVSRDGGNSWTGAVTGFADTAQKVKCVAVATTSSAVIYAGTGAGLLKSADGGRSWTHPGQGMFESVTGISICGRLPQTIYLTAHLPGKNGYWGETRVWRSDDGGTTVEDVTPPFMKYPGAVAVNPCDPDYIYVSNNLMDSVTTQKMLIVRSKDGGRTWEDMGKGIAFGRGLRISIDPASPRRFFVHTRFSILEGYDQEAPIR